MPLEPGLIHETNLTVEESDTARANGGETLPPVLSTPKMIGYLERTAHRGILPFLEAGQSSVGVTVNIKHLAATPAGMQVRFRAELLSVEKRLLKFKVEAWDEVEKIAEGEHERYIIDTTRFEERLTNKSAQIKK